MSAKKYALVLPPMLGYEDIDLALIVGLDFSRPGRVLHNYSVRVKIARLELGERKVLTQTCRCDDRLLRIDRADFKNLAPVISNTLVANDKVHGISVSVKYDMKEQRAQFNKVVEALLTFEVAFFAR